MENSPKISNGVKEELVNLMFHVPAEKLSLILKFLPKTKLPTIRKIAGENWYHVLTFCEKTEARELIPQLKKLGCQDIVEFPSMLGGDLTRALGFI